jgi:hypothetical protein
VMSRLFVALNVILFYIRNEAIDKAKYKYPDFDNVNG